MSNQKSAVATTSYKWLFGTMLCFGIIGLIVSFILSVEEIHLMQHPNAILSCSINIVLNCSTVMQTWQAHVFGFPNMFIGLMAFPVVIALATIALTGAQLPHWLWRTAHIGFALGLAFAYWLFFNSLYAIQVLCPWCLIITFTTTILFEAITRYSLRENAWGLSTKLNTRMQTILNRDFDKLAVAVWIVVLIALVVLKFGSSLFA